MTHSATGICPAMFSFLSHHNIPHHCPNRHLHQPEEAQTDRERDREVFKYQLDLIGNIFCSSLVCYMFRKMTLESHFHRSETFQRS